MPHDYSRLDLISHAMESEERGSAKMVARVKTEKNLGCDGE